MLRNNFCKKNNRLCDPGLSVWETEIGDPGLSMKGLGSWKGRLFF